MPSGFATTTVEKLQSSRAWEQCQGAFFATGEPAPVLADLTEAIDQMALQAYGASLASVFPEGLAMLAVGGFGRRELFPHSDVDIVILMERESQTALLKD